MGALCLLREGERASGGSSVSVEGEREPRV